MSHLRCAWIAVLAIAASGCVLVFQDPDDPPPPVVGPVEPGEPDDPRPDNETARFTLSLCTGSTPGSPTCPFNEIPLDELGTPGTFSFIIQAVGSGLYLNQLELTAGPKGLYVERPTLRFWRSSAGSPEVERIFDVIVNLKPGESIALDTSAFASASPGTVSLRVAAIGPFRP